MKGMISDLAAGGPGDVDAVEALLLLAEWAPFTQRAQSGKVGKGEEDREAWNSSGMALRLAYFLGLEKYSFKVTDDGRDPQFSRKLLVWTACYIADRTISIRIGKAFWSRGPGPLTSLRREHYPSLLPQTPNDEDYASIFQATLELTSLFSNVHDVLYSNVGTSFRSHLSGSYIKFIDDFRAASYSWNAVWGTLTCSPNLKAMLLMSYNYLRLYVNAFAFQATVRRVQSALAEERTSATSPMIPQSPSRLFYNNVGAVGDARFIYEGLDAAKAILTTCNNFINPEKALRFMPLRFFLYLVYSGVFLFRAKIVGVIEGEEERGIRRMIDETIDRLQRSSVGMQHLGSRYSQLLKLLWEKADNHKPPTTMSGRNGGRASGGHHSHHHVGGHRGNSQFDTAGLAHATPAASSQAGSASMGESSPSMANNNSTVEGIGDFSWTDLSTIGEFAVSQGQLTGMDVFGGFLPLEVGNVWDMGQFDGGGVTGAGGGEMAGMAF
ncbi:Transcription factor fungi [Macrophomina phaseolina MS6]|uniref:Transcription factor fungi n=1 Tax=Macrophomina phaseolina (strain MS6) TaxID=1126212 RepID=K2QYQ1_MACPH|nr:Transcription factor fungi [Macrophomina phaseolina MS6]